MIRRIPTAVQVRLSRLSALVRADANRTVLLQISVSQLTGEHPLCSLVELRVVGARYLVVDCLVAGFLPGFLSFIRPERGLRMATPLEPPVY